VPLPLPQSIHFLRAFIASIAALCLACAQGLSADTARDPETLFAQGAFSKARTLWTQKVALPQLDNAERARIKTRIAATHVAESNDAPAKTLLSEVLAEHAASTETHAQAHLLLARIAANYGAGSATLQTRDACTAALSLQNLAPTTVFDARNMLAPALLSLRQFPEARAQFALLANHTPLSAIERCRFQLEGARCLWLEGSVEAARNALRELEPTLDAARNEHTALSQDASPQNTPQNNPQNSLQNLDAERQLLLGLTFYDQGLLDDARHALALVPAMPGQSPSSPQTREAILRLHLRNLIPAPASTLKVLFIGSSHTIRGSVPLLVEQLAASAPPDRPRILAGERALAATGMRSHWNHGISHDTARGRILAESWDAVVLETFYRNSREDLVLDATRYAELLRSRGARMLLYETPAAKAQPYPDAFRSFHENNLWLARTLPSNLAPAMNAWMRILGPHPDEAAFQTLYADWIHATPRGAYLTACCLYAALTDHSPEGLFVPDFLSAAEALPLQRAAWASVRETASQLRSEATAR